MKYAGLLRIKALLDQYLAALADDGYDAIQQALAEFFGDHPEVRAIAWYQGAGLSYLAFELRHGARYLAAEDRLVGAPTDHTFDPAAYAAFADADCVELVREFPNVVVTRTMSKAHALAGLRVGYALCPPAVAEVLHRVRDSYNVDRLAQVAAAAALDDREWLDVTVAQVRATRDRLAAALRKLGWQVNPAAGNFVLAAPVSTKRPASVETAAHCFEFLRAQKILVRRFPNHRLTEKSLRISVGTEQETDVFLQAVAVWMEG